MAKILATSFDLWDTLIQEHPGGAQNVAQIRTRRIGEALSNAGMPHTREEIVAAHDKTGHFLRMVWSKHRDMPVRDQVLFMLNSIDGKLAGRLGPADLHRVEEAYANSMLENPPRLLPGAKETLERVRRSGYRTGLISNTGRTPGSVLRILMKRLGILEYFDVTTFSNEILIRKPSEAAFKHTLEILKVSPRAAVHIGDDPDSDVMGAKRAGLMAVQVLAENEERSGGADYAITSLDALPDILSRL